MGWLAGDGSAQFAALQLWQWDRLHCWRLPHATLSPGMPGWRFEVLLACAPRAEEGLLQLIGQEKAFSGWVGHLPAANPTVRGQGTQAPAGKHGTKRLHDLKPQAAEAQAAGALGAAVAGQPPPAVTDWSLEDPLSVVEQQAVAEEDTHR